jgi:hypothetical protein
LLAAGGLFFIYFVDLNLGVSQHLLGQWRMTRLTKTIEAGGGLQRLAERQDNWNLVCLATPYCRTVDGAPAEMEHACGMTYDDSLYALAYFNGQKLVHVEGLALGRRIATLKSSKPCLSLDEDPVITMEGEELTIRSGTKP